MEIFSLSSVGHCCVEVVGVVSATIYHSFYQQPQPPSTSATIGFRSELWKRRAHSTVYAFASLRQVINAGMCPPPHPTTPTLKIDKTPFFQLNSIPAATAKVSQLSKASKNLEKSIAVVAPYVTLHKAWSDYDHAIEAKRFGQAASAIGRWEAVLKTGVLGRVFVALWLGENG